MSISNGVNANATNFNAAFVSKTANDTKAGNLTMSNGNIKRSVEDGITAHAGGGQGSAYALTKDISRVSTVATAADSVKLPTAAAGLEMVVINDGANALSVYPATGEQIDGLAANTAVSISAGECRVFICRASSQWVSNKTQSPMTTLGDMIYGAASGTATRVAGNTTTTKKFLSQTGDGSSSAAPSWSTIVASDLPTMVGDSGSGGTKGAVPAPSAGDAAALKFLKADGTWATPAGGGGGGLNLVLLDSSYALRKNDNYNAEVSVGDWAAYADAAGTAPVDMTGGSPNTTITRSTSSPLNGTAHFLLTVTTGATRQGEGASCLVYIPPAYRGQTLTFSFPFQTTGTISENDFKPYAYDVTNSVVLTPYVAGKILGSSGQCVCTFPISSTTAQVRVGIHIARASNTGAVTILFDDVSVSPSVAALGMAGSDWVTDSGFTPSAGFGTVTLQSIQRRRVGDSMQVRGYFKAGTVAASTASLDLPSGYNIDTAKITTTSQVAAVGRWTRINTGGSTAISSGDREGPIFFDGSDTNTLFFGQSVSSNTIEKINGSSLMASSDGLTIEFTIPISGWSSNVTMAESSTFRISSYLANGSRVTGSAPTALGQYRSYLRNASAATFTETNGDPTTAPTAADGIKIYEGKAWGTVDTNNQPTRYEIFVGKNKQVKSEWYKSAGRTGAIFTDPQVISTSDVGYVESYDPTTGIYTVTANLLAGGTRTNHYAGIDSDGNAELTTAYFDLIVSENALAVGVQAPRSEIRLTDYAGYGSTATKIPYFTNSSTSGTALTLTTNTATDGASITVNEDGIYNVTFSFGSPSGSSSHIAISKDATVTTNANSLSNTARLQYAQVATVAGVSFTPHVSWTGYLAAGSVIRPHTNADVPSVTAAAIFTICKVSN